jgi:hypothetical protein
MNGHGRCRLTDGAKRPIPTHLQAVVIVLGLVDGLFLVGQVGIPIPEKPAATS